MRIVRLVDHSCGQYQPRAMSNQTLGLAHALGDLILFYTLQEHPDAEAEVDSIQHSKWSMLLLP